MTHSVQNDTKHILQLSLKVKQIIYWKIMIPLTTKYRFQATVGIWRLMQPAKKKINHAKNDTTRVGQGG